MSESKKQPLNIILIRHAESMKNELIHKSQEHLLHTMGSNTSITDRGKLQAESLQYILSSLRVKYPNIVVRTSMLNRTIETYNVTNQFPRRVVHDENLNEWDKSNGEALTDFGIRVQQTIDELYKIYESQSAECVVIFGHSLFFSMLITKIISYNSNDLVFEFPNCSVSSLAIKDDKWAIYQLCDVSHISPRHYRTGTHTVY